MQCAFCGKLMTDSTSDVTSPWCGKCEVITVSTAVLSALRARAKELKKELAEMREWQNKMLTGQIGIHTLSVRNPDAEEKED